MENRRVGIPFVASKFLPKFPIRNAPDSDQVIVPARRQKFPVGADANPADPALVGIDHLDWRRIFISGVPDSDTVIVAGSEQQPAVA